MGKDYYVSEIEKQLNNKVKIIDYISLLRDEKFINELFSLGSTIKQIVIALDENENLIFVDISFMGKFKVLDNTSECKISKLENYKKLKIDNCPQLNGVYTVKGKLKTGMYDKEEFLNVIFKRFSEN